MYWYTTTSRLLVDAPRGRGLEEEEEEEEEEEGCAACEERS